MLVTKRNLEIITIPVLQKEYGLSREFVMRLVETAPNEIGLLPRKFGDQYKFVRGRFEEYLSEGKFC